jgi:hypothetical protein
VAISFFYLLIEDFLSARRLFAVPFPLISVFTFFFIFLIIFLVRYATVGYNAARYKDQFVPSVKMWVFEVGTHFIYSLVYGSYLDRKCRYYFKSEAIFSKCQGRILDHLLNNSYVIFFHDHTKIPLL